MYGKWRRLAALVLTAALLTNQCIATGTASEAQTSEAETQGLLTETTATEVQSAASEPQSAAADSPAAETQSPDAVQPGESAASETQSTTGTQPAESAAAEAQSATGMQPGESTSEMQTAAETQSGESSSSGEETAEETSAAEPSGEDSASEPESQAGITQPAEEKNTASETEEESETETETETEAETELWERKNTGEKVTVSSLTAKLSGVLPYLFVSRSLDVTEKLSDGQKLATEDSGKTLLGNLKEVSLKLANAQSSSEICVLNLYADKDGKLDTTQLDTKFADQVLDVSNQRYVINIIADSEDQTLTFSGFSLKRSGTKAEYTDLSETGDVLYNFVALNGDAYTGYSGTLKLSGNLQGTFLAPQASVEIGSNLAGAVYADIIKVQSTVTDLLRIVFATELPEETESESETETATETDITAESETPEKETEEPQALSEEETATEEETPGKAMEARASDEEKKAAEKETEPMESAEEELQVLSEGEAAAETGRWTEAETATERETEAKSETEPKPETETETETGTEESEEPGAFVVAGISVEAADETEPQSGTEAQTDTEADSEAVPIEEQTSTNITGSVVKVRFTVKLEDGDSGEALEGTVAVKAAQDIVDADGAVIFARDTLVETQTVSAGSAVFGGGQLKYSGDYYLELSSLPEGYQQIMRVYLQISKEGTAIYSSDWDEQNALLTLKVTKETNASAPSFTLLDENGEILSGAVFVIKDENGKVLKNAAGYAQYDIRCNGNAVTLAGLAEGTYYLSEITAPEGYQIAEDLKFTIPGEASLTAVNRKADGGKTIRVSAEVLFADTVLTAEENTVRYAAVFSGEGDTRTRVSEVKELSFDKSAVRSDTVTFEGLTGSSYYVAATNEFGELLQDFGGRTTGETTVDLSVSETKDVTLSYHYYSGDYPEDEFSYTATISITLNVIGKDGSALGTQETFYVGIFRDSGLESAVTTAPVTFAMNGSASRTTAYHLKMTKEAETCYLAETDSEGKAIVLSDTFTYAVTYPGNESGSFTITCGQDTVLTVQNKRNDTLVKIRVVDAAGNYLSGAVLAIKNSSGKVVRVVSETTFESGLTDLEWQDVLEEGKTYYLTEITAPSGYMPASDVKFTVAAGSTTEVSLTNQAITATGYQLSVTEQIYVGNDQVYAKDTSEGKYGEGGAYRYYFALFSDAGYTQKVSDVLAVDIEGFSGSVLFKNLTENAVYYVAETNEYGEVVESSDTLTVKYANGGRVKMSEKERTMAVQNVYSTLPGGYRYTGTLTIVMQVTDSTGAAEAVTKTFYAGIYRNADYSDTPTIVKLELQNASSVSAKRRILLSGSNDMTYYIAEVDASGNRITDIQDFGYVVKIDQPAVTVTKSGSQTVTITNKAKSSKAILYITKKVYDGSAQKKVSETFYAGLFKDSSFTQLYTDPIELKLENSSELTLKLTLNLGSASGATVYVAEVDEDGNVIKNEGDFGYQIKIMNSTAAFDQDHLEIQTILLNSVYGSSSNDDWSSILYGNSSSGEYSWSDNGYASGSASVQTGDNAPLTGYAVAMTVALTVFVGLYRRRRRM